MTDEDWMKRYRKHQRTHDGMFIFTMFLIAVFLGLLYHVVGG